VAWRAFNYVYSASFFRPRVMLEWYGVPTRRCNADENDEDGAMHHSLPGI
jgi:hypothetical protein